MELDEKGKRALRELSDAVNDAIERSPVVADAISRLREMGYEPNLNLRLEIDLQEIFDTFETIPEMAELHLTDDDLRTLQRMKIKI
jgi:hypothetical protein